MVVLDMNKLEKELCDDKSASEEHISLREERKRTGRYIAAGTAIFLCLLGVYQALIQGTPEYAALFAPAVIMFIYVLWILHASRHQNARLQRMREKAKAEQLLEEPVPLIMIEALPEKVDNEKQSNITSIVLEERNNSPVPEVLPEKVDNAKQFNRSYSIA